MCNKVAYISRRDARSAARWLERVRGVQSQHAYECQRCGFWHLTTMSRERAKADVRARRERRRAERDALRCFINPGAYGKAPGAFSQEDL